MTDFVRGKNQHRIISEKKNDEELVSTKRLTPKRSNFNDKGNNIKKKQKTSKTTSAVIKDEEDIVSDNEDNKENINIEDEKDRNLFSSVYHSLKNKKKSKLTNKIEKLTPTQLKEYLSEPSNVLNRKEEADAKKLLPFLKKNIPKSACRLFKKDIHSGMVVLGSFESVSEIDITISLPFGLKGYIKFNEISDSFTEWMKKALEKEEENVKSTNFRKMKIISDQVRKMFYKGQIIKVAIAGLTDHHTIEGLHCTMRPEIVNSGCSIDTFTENMTIHGVVKSIEDKGYIISFGASNDFTGFVDFANTQYYYPGQTEEKQNELYQGQPIEALIETIDKDTKTFKLQLSHSLVSRATVKDSNIITMESIKAGMLVETKVLAVIGNGLHLGFLDFFAGDCEVLHLNNPLDSYKENQGVKARIIFVDQVNKRIGLSTLPHILGYKPYPFGNFKKGQIFANNQLTVERIQPLEMILSSPTTILAGKPQSIKGYVHIEELESGVVDLNKASNQFKKGEPFNKKCRVKHLDYLDGMFTFTARTRELEKKFFSYHDIECGMVTNGVIKYIREDSIEIELAPSIHGVVPKTHLSDSTISNTQQFFKLGQTVKVRVISVDPDKKRLQLTLKKSLIQSEYPIISDKNTTPDGLISHGIITKTTRYLVFVSFYNNCFGVIESQNLSLNPIQSIQKQFPIGKTVLIKTLSNQNKDSQPGLALTMIIDDQDFENQSNILKQLNQNSNQDQDDDEQEEKEQEEQEQEEQEEEEQEEEEQEPEIEEEQEEQEEKVIEEPKNKKQNKKQEKKQNNTKKVEKSTTPTKSNSNNKKPNNKKK